MLVAPNNWSTFNEILIEIIKYKFNFKKLAEVLESSEVQIPCLGNF